MKKLLFTTAAIVSCSIIMFSCSSSEIEGGEYKEIVNMVAEVKPINLTEEQRTFRDDNNGFSFKFLKKVNEADKKGNSFIYSPLGITYVLSMVNDAATGTTEQEIEQTLGFHEGGIQAVNEYCKNLIDNLPKADTDANLNIANAIFLNKDYTLNPQFVQDMDYYYNAKAEALDFKSSKTLKRINDWCNDKTKGMIPNILEKLNPDAVTYLLNAIYFKADWTNKFDPKNTKNETFTTETGTTQIPMMQQDVYISYVKNEIYSAVKIPYGNGLWNMTVMLPEGNNTTDDIINHLSAAGFSNDVENFCATKGGIFRTYEVDLKMPRYETSSDTDDLEDGLISVLQHMGIHLAFDSNWAEIPNMANTNVFISKMRQKAKIEVNEEGTKAAAVTVAEMAVTAVEPGIEQSKPQKATFHANRPFVYVIREASSGVILFVGKFTGR